LKPGKTNSSSASEARPSEVSTGPETNVTVTNVEPVKQARTSLDEDKRFIFLEDGQYA